MVRLVFRAAAAFAACLLAWPAGAEDSSELGKAPAGDQLVQFISFVLAETEDTWHGIFNAEGVAYSEPKLVLFGAEVISPCGVKQTMSGPFYCSLDQKVYLDTEFFKLIADRLGVRGDFAQAYVIAHEVGHHVQNLTGVLPKFLEMKPQLTEAEANEMSVRIELQADCFAGIWGHFVGQKGLLETFDLEEALNAAQQAGDDTIQKLTRGFVAPESFSHGTSEQRKKWFSRGFESGRMSDCDTFNNPI